MGNRNRRSSRRDLSTERDSFKESFLQSLKGHSNSRDRNPADHRALMFCRQVQRSLALALAGEVADDLLQQLSIEAVQPAPTCHHLMVHIGVPDRLEVSLPDLLDRLQRAAPIFRRAIAQDSSRKRVPELSFLPVAPGWADDDNRAKEVSP